MAMGKKMMAKKKAKQNGNGKKKVMARGGMKKTMMRGGSKSVKQAKRLGSKVGKTETPPKTKVMMRGGSKMKKK